MSTWRGASLAVIAVGALQRAIKEKAVGGVLILATGIKPGRDSLQNFTERKQQLAIILLNQVYLR